MASPGGGLMGPFAARPTTRHLGKDHVLRRLGDPLGDGAEGRRRGRAGKGTTCPESPRSSFSYHTPRPAPEGEDLLARDGKAHPLSLRTNVGSRRGVVR